MIDYEYFKYYCISKPIFIIIIFTILFIIIISTSFIIKLKNNREIDEYNLYKCKNISIIYEIYKNKVDNVTFNFIKDLLDITYCKN